METDPCGGGSKCNNNGPVSDYQMVWDKQIDGSGKVKIVLPVRSTQAISNPTQPSNGQGDPCSVACIRPDSDNPWPFSRHFQTGRALLGVSASANPFYGFGYGGGIEWVENQPWGQANWTDGVFAYHGQSVSSVGASSSAQAYIGGIFNYSSDNPTYASPGTAYQGTACAMGICVSVTNTVNDTNGHANGPYAPGVPQSLTIGVGPGIGISGSIMRVNPILLYGKDFR